VAGAVRDYERRYWQRNAGTGIACTAIAAILASLSFAAIGIVRPVIQGREVEWQSALLHLPTADLPPPPVIINLANPAALRT